MAQVYFDSYMHVHVYLMIPYTDLIPAGPAAATTDWTDGEVHPVHGPQIQTEATGEGKCHTHVHVQSELAAPMCANCTLS